MEEGFYSTVFFLHYSIARLVEFRAHYIYAVGAVPVALAALAISVQLKAWVIATGAAIAAAAPFFLRWTLFADVPNGTTPPLPNLGLSLGITSGVAVLVLLVCLLIAGWNRVRLSVSADPFLVWLSPCAVLIVAAGTAALVGGAWLTGGISDAVPSTSVWIGHQVGFAVFLFLANLLPAAMAGALPTRWLRGWPYRVAAMLLFFAALWFLFSNFQNIYFRFTF